MARRITSPLSLILVLLLALSACAPTATPTSPPPTQAPAKASDTSAAKPTEAPKPAAAAATKPAEATKPPGPTVPTATAPAAAAAATKPATTAGATAAAATPAAAATKPAAAAKTGPALKVGLVTDVGKLDDRSFNQSAWEGVQRAQKELGADVKFIETTDSKDYAKNIDQFAQANYDVIVTVGFALGQATGEAAKKYPKVTFIGVDQFQEKETENLAGLIFDEDKAGYLAGALAASMTKSGTIGQVLGTPVVPPVEKFGFGYIQGAKAVKPDVKILSACHPGGLAKGFTDPDWGK
ncbi:MAG TPA: BMP family ABC transporter substrate-binding protein, partial [Chloroflexota bacterium]